MSRITITERDKNVFRNLNDYGFLSTRQIHKLFFDGVDRRTMLKRLRNLQKNKFLRFITGPKFGEYVWYLSRVGSKVVDSTPVISGVNRNTLEHDLLVNELRFSLDETNLFSNWVSSHHMRKHASDYFKDYEVTEPIIPDWISTLEFKDQGKKPIALELELNYKGSKYMERLFQKYSQRHSLHGVWYFVKEASSGRRILDDYRKINYLRGENWVWFSVISDFKNTPLQELKIYTRTGSVLLKDIAEKVTEKNKLTYEEFMKNNRPVATHTPSHSVVGK